MDGAPSWAPFKMILKHTGQDGILTSGSASFWRMRRPSNSFFKNQLKDADVLDVGPGQVPIQLMYFSRNNRAIGIDVDRIIHRRTPWALLQVARKYGYMRAVKMMGRWVLSDRRMQRYVARSLGVETLPWPRSFRWTFSR